MGFMDYTISGSDQAADMRHRINIGLAKMLKKELKVKGNEYNTDGFENVAMYFSENICDRAIMSNYTCSKELREVAVACALGIAMKIHETKDIPGFQKQKNFLHDSHNDLNRFITACRKYQD